MGRPFIIYSDDYEPSGVHQKYELWAEAARKALDESDFNIEGHIDSSSAAVSAILAFYFSKRRLAFLPKCEPAPEGGLGLFESKIGGLPYLLPSESWPCNNDRGLTHLWQLRVNELPFPIQQALGYCRGLLQVFLSENLEEDGKWFMVRVLDESQLVYRDPSEIVPGPGTELLDEQRVTSYKCCYDFPHDDDAFDGMPEEMNRGVANCVLGILQESGLYCTVPGDKLLGWPHWCDQSGWQRSDEGQAYVHVMQVEGDLVPFPIEAGTVVLQRHPTDRQQWDVSWSVC